MNVSVDVKTLTPEQQALARWAERNPGPTHDRNPSSLIYEIAAYISDRAAREAFKLQNHDDFFAFLLKHEAFLGGRAVTIRPSSPNAQKRKKIDITVPAPPEFEVSVPTPPIASSNGLEIITGLVIAEYGDATVAVQLGSRTDLLKWEFGRVVSSIKMELGYNFGAVNNYANHFVFRLAMLPGMAGNVDAVERAVENAYASVGKQPASIQRVTYGVPYPYYGFVG